MSIQHPAFPSIAVIGAGAVGGYYGARLVKAGHDVHFLLRSDFAYVRQHGLVVRSCDDDFSLGNELLNVYDDPRKMPKVDLVLVTLKATNNDSYQELIAPLLSDHTAVLTIQNGLGNEDRLAQLFGPARVLGGMAFVCINREGPGIIHHIDHGLIRLGEFGGGRSGRADAIAALFRGSGVRCEVLDNLRRGRWEKLVWNIPFNGLGALLDYTTDRLIDTEQGRKMVSVLMREVVAAARADGVELARDEEEIAGLISRQIEHTSTMGAYRSSMQIDRNQGRPMEIDAILGEPVRRARAAGIAAPHLEMLYELLSLIS